MYAYHMTWQSLGTYPREMKTCIQIKNLSVFITALLMISRLETTQMSFSEWMNKQTVVHPNPAMKRSGLLRYAPTWVNLEVICLNGKKSISKDYILWYSTYRTFWNINKPQKSTKPIVMENGSLVEKDWEYDGIPWGDRTVLHSDWVSGNDINLCIGQGS